MLPEIKDRVAVGDNKYQMTELSDGRIRLDPSPDSVQEPGTAINKELLQPMIDTLNSLSFYYEMAADYSLTPTDDRTVSDLYNALNNGINLIVVISDNNSLIPGKYFARAKAQAGAFILDCDTQQGVLQWFVASTYIRFMSYTEPVADYVVEQGQKDFWTFRRWASGVAECWCNTDLTFPAANSESGITGIFVEYLDVDLPLSFVEAPSSTCSCQWATTEWVVCHAYTNKIRVRRFGTLNSFSTLPEIKTSIQVKGIWKTEEN